MIKKTKSAKFKFFQVLFQNFSSFFSLNCQILEFFMIQGFVATLKRCKETANPDKDAKAKTFAKSKRPQKIKDAE